MFSNYYFQVVVTCIFYSSKTLDIKNTNNYTNRRLVFVNELVLRNDRTECKNYYFFAIFEDYLFSSRQVFIIFGEIVNNSNNYINIYVFIYIL